MNTPAGLRGAGCFSHFLRATDAAGCISVYLLTVEIDDINLYLDY